MWRGSPAQRFALSAQRAAAAIGRPAECRPGPPQAQVGAATRRRSPPATTTQAVNLFLVGGEAGLAATVLESLREPFLGDGVLRRLRDGACLHHPAQRVGGVSYVAGDGGAFFAGRPILWRGEEADGRAPLDPALYRDGIPEGLDGRFAVGRLGRTGWAVTTDPLGAYPVFRCGPWISNSPEALRRACGREVSLSLDALAGVLGGGWSLSGDPLAQGIARLPWPGARAAAPGRGFSAPRAARLLVAALRALADWPGRPSVVLVTGGRDSRLILAAALRGGFAFSAQTGGTDETDDVRIARALCAAAGIEHRMLPPHPFGDFLAHWREMAAVLAWTTGATATLADAAGFPLVPNPPAPAPLPLWHTGQGGEIARGYYGAAGVEALVARFLGRRPGRRGVLSSDGERRVREQVAGWAEGLRAPAADLGDLFYLQRRMATWAAPTHAAVEYVRDSTSALWSWRLLPDLLGLPAAARRREELHLRVLEELAPGLVDLPFEGDRPWPARQPALARRARRARALATKAAAHARRRLAAPAGAASSPASAAAPCEGPSAGGLRPASGAGDEEGRAFAEIRTAVLGQPGHPAWAVLDRGRVERLLRRPPASWDAMERSYVLRLATVFAGFPAGPAAQ